MNNLLCWFIGHLAPPAYAIYCPHYWCDRCAKQVPNRQSALRSLPHLSSSRRV